MTDLISEVKPTPISSSTFRMVALYVSMFRCLPGKLEYLARWAYSDLNEIPERLKIVDVIRRGIQRLSWRRESFFKSTTELSEGLEKAKVNFEQNVLRVGLSSEKNYS
jgi:hypothetical protein